MNRSLAQFLLIAGLVVLVWGVYSFAANQPKHVKQTDDQTLSGALSNLGNALSTPFENLEREKARRRAVNFMVAGGIAAAVGAAGAALGRKPAS
jgi:hypothetical protein